MTSTNENFSWDQETKDHWVSTMKAHAAADRLVQGSWLRDQDKSGTWRGCFFGCAMQTQEDPLSKAAVAMRLPFWLIHLSERIFERVAPSLAMAWPVQLLEAIPVDTDLSKLWVSLGLKRVDYLKASPVLAQETPLQLVTDYLSGELELTFEEMLMALAAQMRTAGETIHGTPHSDIWMCLRSTIRGHHTQASAAYYASMVDTDAWQKERDALLASLKELASA